MANIVFHTAIVLVYRKAYFYLLVGLFFEKVFNSHWVFDAAYPNGRF